jgi:hypothetical protein
MSNTNYEKYLKYKLKYLELKNELEGGDNELEGGYNDDELEGGAASIETEEDKLKKEIIELFEGIKIEYGNLEKELAQVKAQRQQQQQVKAEAKVQPPQPIRSNNPLINELKQLLNTPYKKRTLEEIERILEIVNTKY